MKAVVTVLTLPFMVLMMCFSLSSQVSASGSSGAGSVENVPASLSAKIVAAIKLKSDGRFNDFLDELLASGLLSKHEKIAKAVRRYRDNQSVQGSELHAVQRLLGIYTRLKHGQDAMDTLSRFVAVPTFRVKGLPQHENPEFHKFGKLLSKTARDFGLSYRNVDNRVFEVSLNGSSDELVGIHAHADVVPVNPELWLLEDGTRLDPFKLTRIGDRMYGRGSEDDKNGIVVSLYAMKVIKEENIPLLRDFRLLVDTTEETTSDAIPYYFSKNPTPNYNLALDGGYPVVIAEKGYGTVMATFPVRAAVKEGDGGEIVNVTGGLATNQIPSASKALILSDQAGALAKRLKILGDKFVAANGANFTVETSVVDRGLELVVKGVSAHSSDPASGVNPVSRMFMLIHEGSKGGFFKQNHITDAARYVNANWGLDFHARVLSIDFEHDFMGPLTSAVTFVGLDDEALQVAVNLRVPAGRPVDALKLELDGKLQVWLAAQGMDMSVSTQIAEPMYRNPKGKWVNALLDVATENLSMSREFGSSAGATSVHNLPNGVQFGLAMPSEKYTGHNANEFKRVDQFMLDLQVVTEMMARIGQMPEL